MSIKPLSYHGFSLDFLVAGSNREKEGKRPGDIMAWRARLQPPPSYPPPCPSTNHRPTTAHLRRRCSLRMSATRSQRRDRSTIPSSIYIPALRNFRLSGARVALSRSKNTRVPSEQTLQLWALTRGLMEGGNWRGVRADKITSLYTADSQAAAFSAQSLPSVFPLNESAAKRDGFRCRPRPLYGLDQAKWRKLPYWGVPRRRRTSSPVTPDGRAEFARLVSDQVANHPPPPPPGMSCGYWRRNAPSGRVRRQLCLDTVVDLQARAGIDKISPSHTSFFERSYPEGNYGHTRTGQNDSQRR